MLSRLSSISNAATLGRFTPLPNPIMICRFLTTDLTNNTIKNSVSGQTSYLIAENIALFNPVYNPYLQTAIYRSPGNAASNSKCSFCVYGTSNNVITFTPNDGFTIAFWVFPTSAGYSSGTGDWIFCFFKVII